MYLAVSSGVTWLVEAEGGAAAWRVGKMRWPRAGGGGEHTDGLLLAGRLVLDRAPNVADAYRFLCADLLVLGGKATAAQPLHKRLALMGAEVLEPRKQPAVDTSSEALRVRQHDCFRLKHVPYLLRQLLPKLTHKHRGLLFLKSDAPHAEPPPGALEWRGVATSAGGGAAAGGGDAPSQAELEAWAAKHFPKK